MENGVLKLRAMIKNVCGGHPLSDEQGSRAIIGTQQHFRKRSALNAETAI